jgi:hypothetical protein
MSKRQLDVGAIVHIRHVAVTTGDDAARFRIQELLVLDDGSTVYKVRNDFEPFDRIVGERDLADSL